MQISLARWLQGVAELRSSAPLMLDVSADMEKDEQQVGRCTPATDRLRYAH